MIRTDTRQRSQAVKMSQSVFPVPDTEAGETLSLYYHAAPRKATPYNQGALEILRAGFREEVWWFTDATGREHRQEGLILFGHPSAPDHIIGHNMEIVLTLTTDELRRYERPHGIDITHYHVHTNGLVTGPIREFHIPAALVNARAKIRILPVEEGMQVVASQRAADAREYARLTAKAGAAE